LRKEIFKGFLWGMGFSISTGLVYIAYAMYTLAAIEFSYKNDFVDLMNYEMASYYERLKPEVLGFEVKDNALLISAKSERVHYADILKKSAFIKFYLFDDSQGAEGKIIGICRQEIESDISDEKYSYYISTCKTTLGLASDVDRVSVAIGTK
jgi:hypothetical protein